MTGITFNLWMLPMFIRMALLVFVLAHSPEIFIFPYNLFASLFLYRNGPFISDVYRDEYDVGDFYDKLNIEEIRREFIKYMQEEEVVGNNTIAPPITDVFHFQEYIGGGNSSGNKTKWRLLPIKTMGNVHPSDTQLRFPFLMSLLHNNPNVVTAFYSILEPGAVIPLHNGYSRAILRYHLGIVVPEPDKCYIEVGGEIQHWQEGEPFMFDDMYPHKVAHLGTQKRIILWLDVTRPGIWGLTRKLIEAVGRSPFLHKWNADQERPRMIEPDMNKVD